MYTYEDIQLLAAELVATADLHCDKDDAISLCLSAGVLRGLMWAGEPVESKLLISEIEWARGLLEDREVA